MLSKFARSYIWPSFLAAALCLGVALGSAFAWWQASATPYEVAGIIALLIAIGSFVPYLHFRVEHIIDPYHVAQDVCIEKSDSAPPR